MIKVFSILGLCAVTLGSPSPLRGDEGNARDLLDSAKEMSLKGEFSGSRRIYRKILTEFPKEMHDQALFWLAYAYEADGSFEKAGTLYRELATDYPASIYADDAYRKLASLDLAAGKPRQAAGALRKLIDTYPESPFAREALLELGDLHGYRLHEFDKALAAYRKYRPDDGAKAEMEWKIRFFEENRDYLEKPLRTYLEAKHLLDEGDPDGAEKLIEEMIMGFPKSAVVDDAILLRGRIEIVRAVELRKKYGPFEDEYQKKFLGHYKTADSYYRQVIRDYPKSDTAAQAQYYLGQMYDWDRLGGLNNFARARQEYQLAVRRHPGTLWAQKARARVEIIDGM